MSTPEFDELLKITDWRKRRGRLLTCTVCAAVVSHDDVILHREWHRKIDVKDHADSSYSLQGLNEPQPLTLKEFLSQWDQVCGDAYEAGQEPTVTLPVNMFPKVKSMVNPMTGQLIPVTRAPMFSWPKVRAERGMVVDY